MNIKRIHMKRTILSSLLFLYPINVCYKYRDQLFLNMSCLAMAVSLINHSHTFHHCEHRRKVFGSIDQKYMIFFSLFLSYRCIRKSPESIFELFFKFLVIFYIYFYLLGGYKYDKRMIENYNENQRNYHMLFHFFSIIGLTRTYEKYVLLRSI
jgi:hypothetical protein